MAGQLRQTLEFDGVIITDDLSGAKQVEYLTPSNRAIDAIEAGVTIVLVSKHPTVAPGMISVTPYPRTGAPSGVALRLTSAADTDGMFRNLS